MSEYINMASRNWNWNGDKGTWVRRNDDNTVTVKKAARGLISDAYTAELREFCAQYGQDFDAIRCGESVTFSTITETAEEKKEENQTAIDFPELTGTAKQIAWADDIRKTAAEKYADNAEFIGWLCTLTSAETIIFRKDELFRAFEMSVRAKKQEQAFLALSIKELEAELEKQNSRPAGMFARVKKNAIARIEARIAELKAAESETEEAPAEEVKHEEKPAAAPVKEWRKFAVNVQNVLTDTGKACKIAFPHSSGLDGFCFWISSTLVRGGRHSHENTVSMHKDMTFTAKKYGAGKWNKRDVIDERPVSQDEIIAAFGGEVSGKYGPKQDVEEVVTHTPKPLAPVEIEAAAELVR